MPIPNPKSGESRSDFISRCVESQSGEDKPNDQKLAICYTKWKDVKKEELISLVTKFVGQRCKRK